jgi:Mn-dependent DtxR family transcriptional regulator
MLQRDVPTALKFLNYRDGLSKLERDYMNYVKYESKSVGTLSALLLVPEPSVEDIEERLIHLGLVEIGSRGRKLTTKGLVAIREVVNE